MNETDQTIRIVGTCNWCGRFIYSNQEWEGQITVPVTDSVITGLVTFRRYHKGKCPGVQP